MKRLIFLVGPTAIGKTEVSIELAKILNCEIVSCDSMQVYRGMDIGTSKPRKELLDVVPHHLIDILEPLEEFSAAQFRKLSIKAIEEILSRNKMPLFVGGSGLYVKALIDGIFKGPSSDRDLRARLRQESDEFGVEILYKRLEVLDPATAAKVHPNDLRRILRALEVYEKARAPISELKKGTRGLSDKYDIKIFGLNMDRKALYKKIDQRVDEMYDAGLVDECRRLIGRKLSLTASQALGYKEVFGFLKGEFSLEEAKKLAKRNTRRFAKRQLTWFRRDERIDWIDVEEDFNSKQIAGLIWKKLS